MWCEILATIKIAKADEILGMDFDESDKNGNSILNVIVTIRTGSVIEQITLNGITLMSVKTSQMNANAIIRTFWHARGWLGECRVAYGEAGRVLFYFSFFLGFVVL